MRQQKITLGEMRSDGGPTRLLIYCGDYKCAHSIEINSFRWPDEVRLSDLEPKFTCRFAAIAAADVRPLFEPARMGITLSFGCNSRYFFSTVQRVPEPGPTNMPVFMHCVAAASHCEGVTCVPERDRPIVSLHACAPPEQDVAASEPMRPKRWRG